jgi:hypothetical protein
MWGGCFSLAPAGVLYGYGGYYPRYRTVAITPIVAITIGTAVPTP